MGSVTTRTRRLVAGAGVLALTAFSLGGFATTASASLAIGNINPNQTGSIIIHKHESGSQTKPGTPDGKTQVGGKGVEGVLFTAYKLTDLDLTTYEGWNNLKNLQVPANACGADWKTPSWTGHNFGPAKQADKKTGTDGKSTIKNLEVGAYLVCETEAPSSVKKKAAPFVVTVPFPNNATNSPSSNDGEWLYNVNVYPKNTVIEAPTKGVEVNKKGVQSGDQLEFPVEAKVPSIADNERFKYFVVSDPFDSSLTGGKVTSVTVDGVEVQDSYYVKTDASAANNNTASVGFTREGLEYLKTKPNSKVKVTFKATVKSVPQDGNIPNTGYFHVDTEKIPGQDVPPVDPPTTPPNNPPVPPTPTNKVVTSWGDVKILKKDADNNKALAKATFQVYDTTADHNFDGTCSAEHKTGEPISVNGETTFTADENGHVKIAGLFVDKKVGAAGQTDVTPDHTHHCYVLVETKAPAGYVLPQGTAAHTALKVTAGKNAETKIDLSVKNSKQDVPELPLTGANGRILMMAGGAALVLLAGGSALVTRSKKRSAA